MNYLFTNIGNALKFDKTFRAKVIGKESNGKYKVLYKNKEYLAKCDGTLNIDDMVWVCAPKNDWNELYVQLGKTLQNQVIQLNSDLIHKKAYTVSYTRGDVGYHASIATLDISDLGLTSLSSIKGITVDSCSTLVSMTGTATTVNTIILSCYTGSAGSDSVNAKVHLFYSK